MFHLPYSVNKKKMINDFESYDDNIVLKYRQAGVSTATAAWASKDYNLPPQIVLKKFLY